MAHIKSTGKICVGSVKSGLQSTAIGMLSGPTLKEINIADSQKNSELNCHMTQQLHVGLSIFRTEKKLFKMTYTHYYSLHH